MPLAQETYALKFYILHVSSMADAITALGSLQGGYAETNKHSGEHKDSAEWNCGGILMQLITRLGVEIGYLHRE